MTKKKFPEYTTVANEPITICDYMNPKVFDFPFFNEGVSILKDRSFSQKGSNISDITPLDTNTLLEIKGFIFHTSHCGSTLLAKMLGSSPQVRIVSETEAINGLFLSYLIYQLPEEKVIDHLQKIIQAYCQPMGKEKYVVFKFTSWNVFMVHLFQKIYPDTPWIYIDRKTEDVVNSLQRSNGSMQNWFHQPTDILRKHFIDQNYKITTQEEYLIHLVEQHRKQAYIHINEQCLSLTYPDFLTQFETSILSHFKLNYSEQEIKIAKDITHFYSKSFEKIPYVENTNQV